jgi:hypothetical protein
VISPRATLAPALVLAGILAGCGSSSKTGAGATTGGARTTTTQATQAQPQASVAVAPGAFTACMARAHWRQTATPADAGAKTLRAQPGQVAFVALTDRAGDRVAVAFFTMPKQAERAQLLTGESVGGNGHATSAPNATIAWVNYSGHTAVDRKVAACSSASQG